MIENVAKFMRFYLIKCLAFVHISGEILMS